ILSFIVIVSILMALFTGIFMNSIILNSYPIAPYLLVLLLWWSGNKMAKLGIRISYTVLSFVLLFLCFFQNSLNLGRLDTLKHRIFDMFGSEIIIGAVVLVILSTIGLYFVNPNYKFNPSATLVSKTGKLTIIFIWIYITFFIVDQSYFIVRHNVAPADFYTLIEENHLVWFRDFIYGRVPYLLRLTAKIFDFFLFLFVTLGLTFTQLYRKINLYPYCLKPIVIVCFGLLFISLANNIILGYIFGISINVIYFIFFDRSFRVTEQLTLNSGKSVVIKYPSRKVIKFWIISAVLLQLLDLIYYVGSFSYSNLYIITKLGLYLLLALFLTISITKFLNNIQTISTNYE
ncbi:MAG: hypothetical protein PHX50_13740, partial [Massilibacteroides sp.]|nr:hypothetical protein [Massilibacteroides sp.]MDD4661383.1 hypothetical protein [Massilibacteroides sp.]